ncbi:hypothetical protein ACFL4F_03265 [Candidatus Margulisiibacteriota bacterium]
MEKAEALRSVKDMIIDKGNGKYQIKGGRMNQAQYDVFQWIMHKIPPSQRPYYEVVESSRGMDVIFKEGDRYGAKKKTVLVNTIASRRTFLEQKGNKFTFRSGTMSGKEYAEFKWVLGQIHPSKWPDFEEGAGFYNVSGSRHDVNFKDAHGFDLKEKSVILVVPEDPPVVDPRDIKVPKGNISEKQYAMIEWQMQHVHPSKRPPIPPQRIFNL